MKIEQLSFITSIYSYLYSLTDYNLLYIPSYFSLDMAFALTATSRLGCQVKVSEEMDGMVIRIPTATRNFYVDGHVPQPH